MAYDDIVTNTVIGVVSTNISNTVEVPVENTRAFAETVFTGLTQLINNDVTLDDNKIDGNNGGSYIPKANILVIDDGSSDAEFRYGIPVSFATQAVNYSRGCIKNELQSITLSAGSAYALGAIGTLKERINISSGFSAGGSRDIKLYCPSNYLNFKGKEVVFFIDDPTLGVGVGDMRIDIYVYNNKTDYDSHTKTNCTRNRINFGNDQVYSITLLLDTSGSQLTFYPMSYIGNVTISNTFHQFWPVTL